MPVAPLALALALPDGADDASPGGGTPMSAGRRARHSRMWPSRAQRARKDSTAPDTRHVVSPSARASASGDR